ncbi:MAG: hypothetical protein OXU23_09505 [Candidatus Poribacteria bacterium]|nr:hypothetical protein [Candidatus Poribacteria bacterium]
MNLFDVTRKLSVLFLIVLSIIGCGNKESLDLLTTVGIEVTDPTANIVTEITDDVWQSMAFYRERSISYYETVRRTHPTPENIELYEQKLAAAEAFGEEQETYFKRQIVADGVEIIGNDQVPDWLFREAKEVLLIMTSKHTEILRDPLKERFYTILTFHLEDVPELKYIGRADEGVSTCIVGHNLPHLHGFCVSQIGHPGNRYLRTFVHETTHAIDIMMHFHDPTFTSRLQEAYQNALEKGIWDNYIYHRLYEERYLEYWAELVEIWFFDVGEGRPFETTEDLEKRDPLGTALLKQWFPQVSFYESITP